MRNDDEDVEKTPLMIMMMLNMQQVFTSSVSCGQPRTEYTRKNLLLDQPEIIMMMISSRAF